MLRYPAPYPAVLFVCHNRREEGNPKPCCHARGGPELCGQLKALIRERGLETRIRVFKSGCLGVCERGPAAMAFPDGGLLTGIRAEDLPAILDGLRTG